MSAKTCALGSLRLLNLKSSLSKNGIMRVGQAYRQITTLEFYEQNKKEYYYLLNKDGKNMFAETQDRWATKEASFVAELPIFKADWPEGIETSFIKNIQDQLSFSASAAAQLVSGMRHGLCSESVDDVIAAVRRLQELEGLFPGFQTESAVSINPRLLRFPAGRLYWSMLTFQDMVPSTDVGSLMASIGHFIAQDPRRCARNLTTLALEIQAQLGGQQLDFSLLRQDSLFLTYPKGEEQIKERVAALVTIFGAGGAKEALHRDLNILRLEPKEVNRQAVEIRNSLSDDPKLDHTKVIDILFKNALL